MEISQQESIVDSLSNFDICMQMINDVNDKNCNVLPVLCTDNKEKIVCSPKKGELAARNNDYIDSSSLKESDATRKASVEVFDIISQSVCSQPKHIINDSKSKSEILNNLEAFERNKSQSEINTDLSKNLNVDIKCQAQLDEVTTLITELVHSCKEYEETQANSCPVTRIKCLQLTGLQSVDEVKGESNHDAFEAIKHHTGSVQTLEGITEVISKNGCSQPTDLKTDLMNDSKQKDDFLCNSTVFTDEKTKTDQQTENLIMDKANMLNDPKISECETIQINQESVPDGNNNPQTYRCESSSSWSDDDDSSSTSSDSSDSFFQMVVESSSGPKNVPEIKTRGELGLDDLPPIEDLMISIPQEDMTLIGKIHAVVDKLVVVHSIKNLKPLDIDSVLFLTHDKPLGRVYDVFGPVVEPFYCIRFNSIDDINKKVVEVGADVFFAPEKNDITSYVFVDELQKEKGSDASWKFNNEPPEECLDFSDDEEERITRRKRMTENRNRRFASSSESAAKKPSLIDLSNSDSNLNNRFGNEASQPQRNNVNTPRAQRFASFSKLYSSGPPPSPSLSVSSVFQAPRFTAYSNPYPSRPPPSPVPSISSVFEAARFSSFSRSYPSCPPPSPVPHFSNVFETPRVSNSYPSCPSSSSVPSPNIFETPRFPSFSSPYSSHPPPSPSPPFSRVFEAPRFSSFSSPYSSHPPPSPQPSVSNIFGAPRFTPFSSSHPPPPLHTSPSPSVSSISEASRFAPFASPYPSLPSLSSSQPRESFSQYQRSSPQYAPQRLSISSLQPHTLRTVTSVPQQAVIHGQSIQGISPRVPQAMPSQYQPTHVFGQIKLVNPLQSTMALPPPPPPPLNMQNFVTPPTSFIPSFLHHS